jgi:hypothetical protein
MASGRAGFCKCPISYRWPVTFFFEGAPNASAPHGSNGSTLSMAEINDFVSDSDGLRLIEAFMRIDNATLRRRIAMLVQKLPVTTATRMLGPEVPGRGSRSSG